MEKYANRFITKIDTKTIGLPVRTNYYMTSNLSYFYGINILGPTSIEIKFERSHVIQHFESTEERDAFIVYFKQKSKEANTFGKN